MTIEEHLIELKDRLTTRADRDLINDACAQINDLIAAAKERDELREQIQWAYDTLREINVSNYDHDEVCRLNDASVEVALGLQKYLPTPEQRTVPDPLCQEAADRIAALEAHLAEAVKVLAPFASVPTHGMYGGPLVSATPGYEDGSDGSPILHERFERARALLKQIEERKP